MALPTSGTLSLNAIHVEAGGTSGTTCSFNDSDIRGLTAASGKSINSTLGTQIDFNNFYGASSVVESTLTTGYYHFTVFALNWRYRGYSNTGWFYGSMNPIIQSSNIANNNELLGIYVAAFITSPPSGTSAYDRRIYAVFDGTNTVSNTNSSAFTSVTINGTTFNRSAATFGTQTGPQYYFYWDETGGGSVNNNTSAIAPFPAVGSTCTVSFT